MTRYPNALPEFSRSVWVSDVARDHWLPRIAAITSLRRRLEVETVYRGMRSAAITDDSPDALSDWIVDAASHGCVAFPLDLSADTGLYAAAHRAPLPGERARQRIAVCSGADALTFRQAWQARDDETMGALLGFPACCRAHYRQVWVADQRIDPTWQQASRTDSVELVDVVEFAPAANVLGRWLGVRQVAHLPCSFTCAATVAVAAKWRDTARALGAGALWDELDAMTRWPVEWSELHGIGQIVTPVWKVIARSDATAERLTVRLHGDEQPAHAARGLVFPYSRTVAPVVDTWTANGFADRVSMMRAHDVLVHCARQWRPVVGSVLDVGCGSGELVRRLASSRRGGVELDPVRHALAVERDPASAYVCADLRDVSSWPAGAWDLTVCMVGRLLEGETSAARAALRRGPVLLYAYNDWLQRQSFDAFVNEIEMADRVELARVSSADAVAVILQ